MKVELKRRGKKKKVLLLIYPNVANVFINMHATIKIWEEIFGIQ